jgi:hypothetical protein
MHKAKKKQLRSWLRIGSTGYLALRLTTPTLADSLTLRYHPPHLPYNLTIDISRGWNRRRPLPIPTLLKVEGGDFRDTLNLRSVVFHFPCWTIVCSVGKKWV